MGIMDFPQSRKQGIAMYDLPPKTYEERIAYVVETFYRLNNQGKVHWKNYIDELLTKIILDFNLTISIVYNDYNNLRETYSMNRATVKQPRYLKGEQVQLLTDNKVIDVSVLEYFPHSGEYFVQELTSVGKAMVKEQDLRRKEDKLHNISLAIPSDTVYYDEVVKVENKVYYIKIQDITNKSI